MKWNNDKGLITYKTALSSISNLLGISEIDYLEREETFPYITYILDYLNRKLIPLSEQDIKVKIQEVFNIGSYGADLILNNGTRDLLLDIGINDSDVYIEGEEIPYVQDRFVFTWSNVMTALEVRLKFQYYELLKKASSSECSCQFPSGDTTKDYENWTSDSKVYPYDENLPYNFSDASNKDWRSTANTPECSRNARTKE